MERVRERLESAERDPVRLQEWLDDVHRLLAELERWLVKLPQTEVHWISHQVVEEDLGAYKVPHLYVVIGTTELDVIPAGAQVVGVRLADGRFESGFHGRVSLRSGAISMPIVRLADRSWKISTYSHPDLRPLDEDAFADALLDLLPASE